MVHKGLIANSMLEAEDNKPFLSNPDWLNRNVVGTAAQYKRSLANPVFVGVATSSGTAVSAVFVAPMSPSTFGQSHLIDKIEGHDSLQGIDDIDIPHFPAVPGSIVRYSAFVSEYSPVIVESRQPTVDLYMDDFGMVITDENTCWDARNWRREETPGSILNIILSSRSPSVVEIQKEKNLPVDELISRLDRSEKIPYGAELAGRVRSLRDAANEEYEIQMPITGKSLEGLVNFLDQNPEAKMPEVVLHPNGNVRAEWGNSLNSFFGLEFLDGYLGKYVVFIKDAKYSEETLRNAGESPLETLLVNLSGFDIKSLIIRDGEVKAA